MHGRKMLTNPESVGVLHEASPGVVNVTSMADADYVLDAQRGPTRSLQNSAILHRWSCEQALAARLERLPRRAKLADFTFISANSARNCRLTAIGSIQIFKEQTPVGLA